jgi:hypothetical protein
MKTVKKYISKDGKEFYNKSDCKTYEKRYKETIELARKLSKYCTEQKKSCRKCPFFEKRTFDDVGECILKKYSADEWDFKIKYKIL